MQWPFAVAAVKAEARFNVIFYDFKAGKELKTNPWWLYLGGNHLKGIL